MRLRGLELVLFAVGALAGCAGAAQKSADAGYVTVCTEEAQTGSHIGRTRCHRRYDEAERRRRDQAHMQYIQSEIGRRKIVEEPPKPRTDRPQQLVFSSVRSSGSGSADRNQEP